MKKVIAIVSIPINESCLIVDIESPVVVGRFMPDVVLDSDIDIDIDIDILLIELILTDVYASFAMLFWQDYSGKTGVQIGVKQQARIEERTVR